MNARYTLLVAILLLALPLSVWGQTVPEGYPPNGFRPLPQTVLMAKIEEPPEPLSLPSSLDWRDAGIITTPKNQSSCGCCWAFAAIGCMEAMCRLAGASSSIDFSEQYPTSCDSAMYLGVTNEGCCGGTVTVFEFLRMHESWTETQFPFNTGDREGARECSPGSGIGAFNTVPCPGTPSPPLSGWQVSTWTMISSQQIATVAEMKTALQSGPVWLGYYIYEDFYDYWGSATTTPYVHTYGANLGGHAVLLIGYNDSPGYWIVKNSWGATGGPFGDGTFRVDYNGNCSFGINAARCTVTGADPPSAVDSSTWTRLKQAFRD